MPRKSKTPPALARVITERYPVYLAHTEEKLRVLRTVPPENQADHIRGKTEAEIIARLEGYQACLEDAMHEANCYAGFNHYGPAEPCGNSTVRHSVREGEPGYEPWRKLYYTRGNKS
jgi:hypothetical protein